MMRNGTHNRNVQMTLFWRKNVCCQTMHFTLYISKLWQDDPALCLHTALKRPSMFKHTTMFIHPVTRSRHKFMIHAMPKSINTWSMELKFLWGKAKVSENRYSTFQQNRDRFLSNLKHHFLNQPLFFPIVTEIHSGPTPLKSSRFGTRGRRVIELIKIHLWWSITTNRAILNIYRCRENH